jgi:glycosyltransferase involved in cell wall biosynthesis
LVHVFPAFGGGGPEVRTAEIINRTAGEFRHTVLSLCSDLSGQERLGPQSGVQLSEVADAAPWKLARLLRSLHPDLLLTYGWGGTDAIASARLAGIRRVVHSEDGFLNDEACGQKLSRQIARRILFKAAHTLIVPSQTLLTIARRKWKVSNRRLRYIPNGIDTSTFQPRNGLFRREVRSTLGISNDRLVVGTVGGLRPEKNQLRLLRAFARISAEIPTAHLMMVGDGPLLDAINREAREHGIEQRLTLCGRVSNPSQLYAAMDVFALSSDSEQMPLVVLEAMSAGMPIVSTDVGDVRLMLTPQNRRWVMSVNDEAEFSNALRRLLLDQGLRSQLGADNRRHCVGTYSLERMLSDYVELYQDLTSQCCLSK